MTVAPEPTEVRAGDTVKWTRDDLTATYPASGGWSLDYYLRNATASIDIGTSANAEDPDAFDVDETAATTAGWAAGEYRWIARVSKGAEVYTVETGTLLVKANLAAAGGVDDREHAEKVLTAIEAVIEGRASKDQASYTIGNRSLSRTSLPDLLALRDKYRKEVARLRAEERLAQGLNSGRTVHTRFV